MRICVVTPAPPGSRLGNRVTAERWARLLRELGHAVQIQEDWRGEPCDLLVALHARKSADTVQRYLSARPGAPVVVGGIGTDVYEDLPDSVEARQTFEAATRIVVLQPHAIQRLPEAVRDRALVVFQSAPTRRAIPDDDAFGVCFLGHLREVKDPFLLPRATRRLPASSRVRVVQVGGVLEDEMLRRTEREMSENPRYLWLGELSHDAAQEVLTRSRLLVVTSRSEGGANVVSEALAAGVPVLSTRIDGTTGVLGDDYPGLFPIGDEEALADLLERAESDPEFLDRLRAWCARSAELVRPELERECWRNVLRELFPEWVGDRG